MSDKLFTHMFKSLVDQIGGVEAAAAAIGATLGHSVSIGTVSKISNGNAEVPLAWAYALQDATGNFCFDDHRARGRAPREVGVGPPSHLDVLREATEAVQAIAQVEARPSTDAVVRAFKEVADVHEQTGKIRASYGAILKDRRADQ